MYFFMDGKNRGIYVYQQIVENDSKPASLLLFYRWISDVLTPAIKDTKITFIEIHMLLLKQAFYC